MTTRVKLNLISTKIAAALVVSFFVALVPMSIDANSGNAHMNDAYADVYSADWEGFLDIVSDAANLTPNELVTTCPAILSGAYGISLVKGAGMAYSRNLAQNLDALADSAEYPAWDSMTASERESWGGDKEKYDAYKYAMFLSAFGLKDTANEYSSFNSSGGGSFTLAENVVNRLQQIGRIGRNWVNSGFETVSSLRGVVNEDDLKEYLGVTGSLSFNAEDLEGWPSTVPQHLDLGYQSMFTYTLHNGSQSQSTKKYFSREVYFLVMRQANKQGLVVYFDETAFAYGSSPNPTYVVSTLKVQDSKSVYGNYMQGYGVGNWPRDNWTIDLPVNEWNRDGLTSDLRTAIWLMLYSGRGIKQGGVIEPDVPDYPESDANGNDRIWYPVVLTPNITYPDLTTPPRPDNPYNPDNQTGTDKWRNETTNNVLPLAKLPFDKLFPFCLLYDLPLLLHKILDVSGVDTGGGLRAQSVPDYEKITLDWPNPGSQEPTDFVIDLKWLHDLLTLVRPVLQVLLLFGFLWASIQFWKGVITG